MLPQAVILDARTVSTREAGTGARAELLNESEFQDLYRLQARPLWAYLYRLTGNTADADDLLQEAFCRLLATPLATRDEGQLRAYLYRVASNAAIDLWRRGGRAIASDGPCGLRKGQHVGLDDPHAALVLQLAPQQAHGLEIGVDILAAAREETGHVHARKRRRVDCRADRRVDGDLDESQAPARGEREGGASERSGGSHGR